MSRVVNYGLRPAKNIERKLMAEAFGRLAPVSPLSQYRYVGFGSEFFNDFLLYHQTLGIRSMISIEEDDRRINRCKFNIPYRCVQLRRGNATHVLPTLSWSSRSIVWLDYTGKLDRAKIDDLRFLVSQARSGSMLVWSVNANPWSGDRDEESGDKVRQADWPAIRIQKLQELFGNSRTFDAVSGSQLTKWGLAALFYEIVKDEISRALNNRNAAAEDKDRLRFDQCFHFRYADGQRMLTVGGVLLNPADREKLGSDPFSGLWFVRDGVDALEIRPPALTAREARHLNSLLPHAGAKSRRPRWLSEEELADYRLIYRYYPIFAEAEL